MASLPQGRGASRPSRQKSDPQTCLRRKPNPSALNSLLTSPDPSGIKDLAAVAATRGDLGQLAPRKKLLKSFSSFLELFLRPSEHFGTEGFSFLSSLLP